MERIRLNKQEKQVFRMITKGSTTCPCTYPESAFYVAVRTLELKGLVKGAYIEGGAVEDTAITPLGYLYLTENPSLRNPINWGVVSSMSTITLLLSIVAIAILIR